MSLFRQFLEEKVDRNEFLSNGRAKEKKYKELVRAKDRFLLDFIKKYDANKGKFANRGQLKAFLNRLIKKNEYSDFFDLEYKIKSNDYPVIVRIEAYKPTLKIKVTATEDLVGDRKTDKLKGIFVVEFWNK